jgi:hypothetical protein
VVSVTGVPAVIERELAAVRRRLAALRTEEAGLEAILTSLQSQLAELEKSARSALFAGAAVTSSSPSSAKVDLFCSLFRGRTDVFPVPWENRNTGKAGYSPACANEWAGGSCAKPKGQMRAMPASGVHCRIRRPYRQAPARR